VDDGSSDGSSEELDRLAGQHSQIRVFPSTEPMEAGPV
jgi:hypothetical protein